MSGSPRLSALAATLTRVGFVVHPANGSDRPSLVATHPARGVVCLEVVESAVQDATVHLNRKVAALREDVPDLRRIKITRRVVDATATSSTSQVLTEADALRGTWLDAMPFSPLEDELVHRIDAAISQRIVVEVPRRSTPTDHGAEDRARARVVLDEQQAAVARRDVEDVLLITGPPGSGKTLVLAARARRLAELHPDWEIQFLCYNRLLVPYLQALVADHTNVRVDTFGKFAFRHGFQISLDDEARAQREVRQALHRARPVVDALLIDEWQDFSSAWTKLALALLRPERGGVVLAGDPMQALYRDSGMAADLSDRTVAEAWLGRPYRSTRQILEVTSAMDPVMDIAARSDALDGEPVDLVWAHSAVEQAASVARDIRLLLDGEERRPQDIGVLVTRKWHMGQVQGQLAKAGVPSRTAYPKYAEQLDLAEPTVKIMTVHSAKGYEFDVVFLVGLEHLPEPDGTVEAERQGRTGYVGATRARDQLVMTYSKDNAYLERIRSLPETTLRRWVWPDDYPEV